MWERDTEKEIEGGIPICYLFCVCNMTFSFLSCQCSNWIKLKIDIGERDREMGDGETGMKNTEIIYPITVHVWCEWYTLDFAHLHCSLKAPIWTCISSPCYQMEPIPEALCCDVWGPPPPSELSSSLARVDELSAATKPIRNLYLNKFIIFPFKNFIQGYSALRQDMTPYRTNKALLKAV